MSTKIEVNNYFLMTLQLCMKIFYFYFCNSICMFEIMSFSQVLATALKLF